MRHVQRRAFHYDILLFSRHIRQVTLTPAGDMQ
jgi:hypothetical protein